MLNPVSPCFVGGQPQNNASRFHSVALRGIKEERLRLFFSETNGLARHALGMARHEFDVT
jgi:hypothetical protein